MRRSATASKTEKRGETGTQAVDRAIAILFSFTDARPERRLVDLSEELGLNKSTVHRLLQALGAAGLVRRDERQGVYRLGAATLELGARFLATLDLRAEARPHIEALARTHGEAVNLAVLDGTDALSIDNIVGTGSLQLVSKLGRRIPIYCSASGKALLLDMADADIGRLLGGVAFQPLTRKTATGVDEFLRRLQSSRRQGWAFNDEESEIGMRAVAAPVRDHLGMVVAAVTVSAPTFRMDKARVAALARAAIETADAVTATIGGTAQRR